MGTTNDFFQDFGNLAALMEMLNNLVKEGAMLAATPLNILADIPSGPLALLELSDVMRDMTSSHVQRSSVGTADCKSGGVGEEFRGGTVELKHSEKKVFNIFAFSWLDVAVLPR